jgi:hypothetical protein
MAQSRPFYQKVVRDHLKVSEEFLGEHADVIREKLNFAAAEILRERGHIFAINQCLHLAGSLVLHCASLNLNYALDKVRQVPEFYGKDPTTVVTIAMLYHLLETDVLVQTEQDRESREVLLKQFRGINWMIGGEALEALGIGEEDGRKGRE